MYKPLYFNNRVRCAISISPDFLIHIGHLFILACSKVIAEKENVELHLRFDDTYAACCKNYQNYPAKKDSWASGNPHQQIPGRAIYEWYRPTEMTKKYIETIMPIIDTIGIEVNKTYKISDVEKEIRSHYEYINLEWLADMPIYFTEDLAWNITHICRGEEWDLLGEYSYWSKMQIFLLENIKRNNFKIHHIKHIKTNDGEKISKSDVRHSRYMLNNMHIDEIKSVWKEFYNVAKKEICDI